MNIHPEQKEKRKVIIDGVSAAWPICLVYIAAGLAFGVIAQKAGISPVEIFFMSLFVYAGSSQFIAAAMIGEGVTAIPIILTTFVVNLRHLLMSSSLSAHLKYLDVKKLSLFAYGVTDESFAVNLFRFKNGDWDWKRALVVNHVSNATWIASTVAGGYGGQFIPAGAFGIDYSLTAMFLCLLVFQLRDKMHILIAIISGVLAVFLSILIPGNSYIVAASVIAATVGVLFSRSGFPKGKSAKT
jgi:4-azaleucine resistance transporter AzlC